MKHVILFLILTLALHLGFGQSDRHNTSVNNAWLSCSPSPVPNTLRGNAHWIMYDFKDTYALTNSKFWNFNTPLRVNRFGDETWFLDTLAGSLNDGIREVFIDLSIDGVTWNEWGRYTIPKANASGFYEGATGPDFGGKIARFVLITARSNYGGRCYGLSEVKIDATPATISSTDEELGEVENWISVSPNPAKDMIVIGLQSFQIGEANYSITDLSGRLVKSGSISISEEFFTFPLSVNDLPNNLYILSISQQNNIKSVKFEVIK